MTAQAVAEDGTLVAGEKTTAGSGSKRPGTPAVCGNYPYVS